MNLKKGQQIRVNITQLKSELDLNYKLVYKSIPFRMRTNEFYTKHLSDIEENNNKLISKMEKENPIITNVGSDGYLNIMFSDKSEAGINSKHVVEVINDVVVSKPKVEEVKKVEPKKTETKKVEPKKSSSLFKKKK